MISIEDIRAASQRIQGRISRTPMVHSAALSRMLGGDIYLKLENLQKTGSFKIRGATNKILSRRKRIDARGVVAASAGNHAQGVALAARNADIPATIVMPEWVSITKQEATRAYGGRVVIHGQSVGESLEKAREYESEGKTFIHPFDDPEIIAGQGSIGLEILDDLPDVDLVLVPIGGGGLISGVAAAIKAVRPQARVVGVQAAACPAAQVSRANGKITPVESFPSIADGISVKAVGRETYAMIERYVDDILLVEEEQIAAAMLLLLERKKILVEGSGAVPLAALLAGLVPDADRLQTVLLISGGNVDSPLLGRIISKGLRKHGRVVRLRVRLADTPGSLAVLLAHLAQFKANVLHIAHDRSGSDLPMYVTRVDLELETRGPEHVEAVVAALEKLEYHASLR